MTKWEYKRVTNKRGEPKLNELGRQKWRLHSVFVHNSYINYVLERKIVEVDKEEDITRSDAKVNKTKTRPGFPVIPWYTLILYRISRLLRPPCKAKCDTGEKCEKKMYHFGKHRAFRRPEDFFAHYHEW